MERKVFLKDLLRYEDDVVAKFGTSSDFQEYQCIISKDSTDVSAALEDTLHRILDAGGSEYDADCIMNAHIADEEELLSLDEFGEYISIDLGYIIPGTMLAFNKN